MLAAKGYGQLIRDDGPTTHHTKRGTPTMGGLVIILSVVLAYFVAKLVTQDRPSVVGAAAAVPVRRAGLGRVPRRLHQDREAAQPRPAQQGQDGRSDPRRGGLRVLALTRPDERGQTPASLHLSFIRDFDSFTLPAVVVVLLILVMIAGRHNAVNLTDGLDGLATGTSTMVFGAYTLVNIWQNNQWCALTQGNKCYDVRDPLDLAAIAAALTGACFGFLWWNASPAKIFMGDTGSLALGGALAGLAILTRTEFLLAILGGLFVIITLSVILQVGYFKLTGGRRIFRMAPLQHHFELKGWAEITIMIRFWIITGICVAAGLGHLLRRVGRRRMSLDGSAGTPPGTVSGRS